MKITSEVLISELIELTKQHINQAEQLNIKPINELNWKADENTWSVLECIEHLNLYGNFYLPEIELKINRSKTKPETYFKPGVLGGYFAKSMLPKEKLNKMKTFKSKNPKGSKLNKKTLDQFLEQQKRTLNLLNKARKASLNTIKIPTTLGSLVKLKLGDTFRFILYHNYRHMVQVQKNLELKME